MKTLSALLCVLALAGCANNYRIHTVDGKVYQTSGHPVFERGGYTFVDTEGEQHFLTLARVHLIEE